MGYVLYPLAVCLFWLLFTPLFVLSLLADLANTERRLWKSALVIDVLGAVLFAPVWNAILITRNAVRRFGELWLSISEVLGYAQQERTLTALGRFLVYLLHRLDPYHCEYAIGLQPIKPVRKWWQVGLALLEVLLIVFGPLVALAFFSLYLVKK